jgi:hypothetical protein
MRVHESQELKPFPVGTLLEGRLTAWGNERGHKPLASGAYGNLTTLAKGLGTPSTISPGTT